MLPTVILPPECIIKVVAFILQLNVRVLLAFAAAPAAAARTVSILAAVSVPVPLSSTEKDVVSRFGAGIDKLSIDIEEFIVISAAYVMKILSPVPGTAPFPLIAVLSAGAVVFQFVAVFQSPAAPPHQ